MAADDPRPGVKSHGLSGYKAGCRCFVCRRGKADDMNAYRARRRQNAGDPLTAPAVAVKIPADAGRVERHVRVEISGLNLVSAEADTLTELALVNAKLIDTIPESGRWHLLGTAERLLLDVMDRLRASGRAVRTSVEDEADSFVNSLGHTGKS